MATDRSLDGWHVLVTRPRGRAAELLTLLEEGGAVVTHLPVLEITPATDCNAIRSAAERSDIAVFVSVNAVESVASCFGMAERGWINNIDCCAVGGATSKAMSDRGWPVYRSSPSGGSEGLIAALGDTYLEGREVAIFAAESGRRLLHDWFASRGAIVHEVVSYRRSPAADVDTAALRQFMSATDRIIVLTSNESVDALESHVDSDHRSALHNSNLTVISDRVARHCRSREFIGEIEIADQPDSTALAAATFRLAAVKPNR